MRSSAVLAVFVLGACSTRDPGTIDPQGAPGGSGIALAGPRVIVGHTYAGVVEQSPGDQGAPASFLLADLTCTACTVTHDPTGEVSTDELAFSWVPDGSGPVTVDATLSWPDGEQQHAQAQVTDLDREVAVMALCYQQAAGTEYQGHPCGAARSASDSLWIRTWLVTAAGSRIYPGCVEAQICVPGDEPSPSAFSIAGVTAEQEGAVFYLDDPGAALAATISATLATGDEVSISIPLPALTP